MNIKKIASMKHLEGYKNIIIFILRGHFLEKHKQRKRDYAYKNLVGGGWQWRRGERGLFMKILNSLCCNYFHNTPFDTIWRLLSQNFGRDASGTAHFFFAICY